MFKIPEQEGKNNRKTKSKKCLKNNSLTQEKKKKNVTIPNTYTFAPPRSPCFVVKNSSAIFASRRLNQTKRNGEKNEVKHDYNTPTAKQY